MWNSGASKITTQEIDNSIVQGSPSFGSFFSVFISNEGPAFTPIMVGNANDLETRFGKVDIRKNGLSQLAALLASNNTSANYCVRAVPSNATYANILFTSLGAESEAETPVEVSSKNLTLDEYSSILMNGEYTFENENQMCICFMTGPGNYGNKYKIAISNIDSKKETFTLNLYRYNGSSDILVESFDELSINPSAKDYNGNSIFINDVINQQSRNIKFFWNEKSNFNFSKFSLEKQANIEAFAKKNNALQSGADGAFSDMGDNTKNAALLNALSLCEDKKFYDISMTSDMGEPSIRNAVIDFCEKRGDCSCILSCPTNCTTSATVIQDKTSLNSESTYAIYYGFSFKARFLRDNIIYKIPVGLFAIENWLSVINSPTFFETVMSHTNGDISPSLFTIVEPNYNLKDLDLNKDEIDKNNICFPDREPTGYYFSDEQTLLNAKSSLAQFHNRNTLSYLKKMDIEYLKYYIGKFSTDSTLSKIEKDMKASGSNLVKQGALTGADCQCNSENNPIEVRRKRGLVVLRKISMPDSIKYILIQYSIEKDTVTASEA